MNDPHQPPLSSRVGNVDDEARLDLRSTVCFAPHNRTISGEDLMSALVRVRLTILPSEGIYEVGIEPDLIIREVKEETPIPLRRSF